MAKSSPYLTWCIVSLGDDVNWWVKEISDDVHWDVDALSIIDPKQIQHIIDLMEPLREYGLQPEIFEAAFYPFIIEAELDKGKVRLVSSMESFLESDEPLFALPDILDEEKGPYADFINHITKLRVMLLNDMFDFEQPLTVEEIEDELRESQNNDFMEGRCTHLFNEVCDILEYVPHGYEIDADEFESSQKTGEEDYEEDIPDLEEDSEKLEEDETMRWDEEDEEAYEEAEKNA